MSRVAAMLVLMLASPAAAGVRATIAGRAVRLDHGLAIIDAQHLHLYLSDAPVSCPRPPIARAVTALHLAIPPGPGGRFYAGTAIGAELSVEGPGGLAEDIAIVRLGPVGRRARGTLDGELARGNFDVPVCDGAAAADTSLPEAAPPGPVRGTVRAAPFVARSGLALLQARPQPALLSLRLYQGDRAVVVVPTPALLLEGPQPMEAFVEERGVLGETLGRGWISVAALRATAGATIFGELVTGKVAGRFQATVRLAPE